MDVSELHLDGEVDCCNIYRRDGRIVLAEIFFKQWSADAECELKRKSEYFACIYPAFGNAEAAEYLAGKASEWNVPIESLKGKCSLEMMETMISHGPKRIRNLTIDRSLTEAISVTVVECLKERLDKGGMSDERKE